MIYRGIQGLRQQGTSSCYHGVLTPNAAGRDRIVPRATGRARGGLRSRQAVPGTPTDLPPILGLAPGTGRPRGCDRLPGLRGQDEDHRRTLRNARTCAITRARSRSMNCPETREHPLILEQVMKGVHPEGMTG